jgi:uncharacterized protein YbgA (DUF1722 family)/uncharacterized protein YbbK (DUF523 family)
MKPRVGISACLLGQKVRYNGADKRNDWLVDRLGKFVTWVPLCPEMEMGLGVPRKTMRLSGKSEAPQLLVHGTDQNLTELAHQTSRRMLARDLNLDSYIFKKDSPSCGLERVKIYGKGGSPSRSAVGLFAGAVLERYPGIPVIEEGRLTDLKQRELYAIRLFAFHRFHGLERKIAALQKFHQIHKLLLMAHAPDRYQALGKIAANPEGKRVGELFAEYEPHFFAAIGRAPTRKQWINVLQHVFGYFKEKIGAPEKKGILATIEEYRRGELPLIAVLTLLRHLVQSHGVGYLKDQLIFEPYPRELALEG